MKIRVILGANNRYYLRNVTDLDNIHLIGRDPKKPVYFTKRDAAEKYIKARAAQGWEQV